MTNTNSTLSNLSRRQLCEQHNVKVVPSTWSEYYKGTKESLIAANILKDGQFPGDEGNNKTSLRIAVHENGQQEIIHGKIQLKRCNIIRVVKYGNRFEVAIPYSDEERRRLSKIEEYEHAIKEEEQKLALLSSNRDHARNKHLRFMKVLHGTFIQTLEAGVDGYHYDEAVIDEYKDHCNEMWELLNNARITINKKERENIELKIRSEKLAIDSGFTSFMNMVTESSVNLNE